MDHEHDPEGQAIAGMLEQALSADLPLYFFDLAHALERAGLGSADTPGWLRGLCEDRIGPLSEGDITLFTANGFYLLIGSCEGAEADALAARVDKAMIELFGAEDKPQNLLGPSPARAGDPMDLALIERARAIMGPSRPPRFATLGGDGKSVKDGVQLCFAPVRDLRRGTPMLFQCTPVALHGETPGSGYRAFRDLTPQDYAALDCAMLEYGAAFARALCESGSIAAVAVPVHAETLSWSRGRQRYLALLRDTEMAAAPQLLPVIDGLANGTLPERIAELVGMLKPHARRVVVSLPDIEVPLDASGLIGAAGFSLALPWYADTRVAQRWSRWLERACAIQNAFAWMSCVNNAEALAAVRANPIRFACGAALGPTPLTRDAALDYARVQGFSPKRDIA